jgi:hypothetical protein
VDENSNMLPFFEPDTYAAKIEAAFSFEHRVPPGTKHIYHTSDTFILVRLASHCHVTHTHNTPRARAPFPPATLIQESNELDSSINPTPKHLCP